MWYWLAIDQIDRVTPTQYGHALQLAVQCYPREPLVWAQETKGLYVPLKNSQQKWCELFHNESQASYAFHNMY